MISPEPYLGWKVYGPYKRKDNRSHVCLVKNNSKIRKTVSYPKYLVEVHLGRLLEDNEEVHHKNDKVDDNRLDNFEIIDGNIHKSLTQQKYYDQRVQCKECKKIFILTALQQRNRLGNANESGPFCSRKCSGKWSTTGENQRLGHSREILKNWKVSI